MRTIKEMEMTLHSMGYRSDAATPKIGIKRKLGKPIAAYGVTGKSGPRRLSFLDSPRATSSPGLK